MYYIYLIVNKVNGKTYVGQRKSSKEWYEDKYMGSGKYLKSAKIQNMESKTLKSFLFNIVVKKKKQIKISEAKKGIPLSDEHRRKLSESLKGNQRHKGHHHTDETKRRISESKKGKSPCWNKGKHWSEEHRKKLSEAHKGQVAWNKGKKGLLHLKLVDGKRVYYQDMEK